MSQRIREAYNWYQDTANDMTEGNVLAADQLLSKSWFEFDYTLERLQAYGERIKERLKKK